MVVCKYWKQGNCRNGNNCRFEHPSSGGNNNNNNSNNSSNSTGNNSRRDGFGGAFGSIARPERWLLNEDDIRSDLTNTTPKWALSAYGPGKDTPATLFTDNEFSPEEIRWRFYQAQAAGQPESADREAVLAWTKAQSDVANAAGKTRDVQDFMLQKEKEHPNRYDLCRMDGSISKEEHSKNVQLNRVPGTSVNPFGAAQRATPTTNPFARPAFGQVSQATAFGQPAQPSAFGKPAFGQTGFGQPTPQKPAFGQAVAPQPAFGQTGFGQSTTQQPAFGQAGFASKSPFGNQGQPSPFGGQPLATASAFGQTSSLGQSTPVNPLARPTVTPGFGQTGFGGQASGFGNSAPSGFGSGVQTQSQSPFGNVGAVAAIPATSGFGSNTPTQSKSPFGNVGAPPEITAPSSNSPFGASTQPQAFAQPEMSHSQPQTGFGQNPFGAAQSQSTGQPGFGSRVESAAPHPFAATASPAPMSPFGTTMQGTTQAPIAKAPNTQETASTKPTNKAVQPLYYTQTLPYVPPQFDSAGKLVSYRSLPVKYDVKMRPDATGTEVVDAENPFYRRPDGKGSERIWFPKGALEDVVRRVRTIAMDLQLEEDQYSDQVTKEYAKLFEEGRFEQGVIPLIPPMRGWVDYDF